MTDLLQTSGLVFNIMRFAVHDGPGIRTTVFLKGCPLACAWCHNPESISMEPELMLNPDRCIGCGACIEACRQGAIVYTRQGPITHRELCQACGACVEVCPAGGRARVGEVMSTGAVMEAVLADRVFYDQSGGGVTFSGGEPTYQSGFLQALLMASRMEELHTVVDTCGFAPWRFFDAIAPLTDLFLFDVKMIDPEKHRHWTGVSNRLILKNLERLDADGRPLSLRLPILPGINDDAVDMEKLMRWLARLRHVRQLHLLPYHPIGNGKYYRLGRNEPLQGLQPPSQERLTELAAQLAQIIETVTIGG
ncbi:MAG TPA: glycyl-radical enzyme activating protein [bacterium]|nr:glycyl-radical enzyme activating protein [bacterium]HQI50299.1 glycyl-radical enzyme activating protein [bacterium]HQJ65748.1 glycyl-radical enzyme activating protein [bacterium]